MSTAALLRINAPGPGQTPVTAGAASSAANAIPSGATKLWLKATAKAHIRFGDSSVGAATPNDQYLTADQDYVLDLLSGITHFRAIRGDTADATITWVAL
ncbi:hypothetical protein [Sandaracinus amylolyticus]|uniref:Uncharacterized protein n=1 Tax=Sandaracinus amylolyticus TaxID=927083 RepID=A0A0F6YKK2_9BACT|nr:hypothetical protein [Sandaracinus amylolyticus]AKF08897.1 hypothetical protein DB32_006046 [Sandaracinus amylolyticus]